MKLVFSLALAFLLGNAANAQSFPAYTADMLMDRVSADTVYVVNFWATWCAPCVKELPVFDGIQDHYKGKKVKVLLVSFDFKNDYQQKLTEFVAKKGTKPEILWFSDTDAGEFIPKIEESWSGALPGTMIIKGASKTFLEKTVTAAELIPVIDKKLQ